MKIYLCLLKIKIFLQDNFAKIWDIQKIILLVGKMAYSQQFKGYLKWHNILNALWTICLYKKILQNLQDFLFNFGKVEHNFGGGKGIKESAVGVVQREI